MAGEAEKTGDQPRHLASITFLVILALTALSVGAWYLLGLPAMMAAN
jgi:hypothetical protein